MDNETLTATNSATRTTVFFAQLLLKAWFQKVKQRKHVYIREHSWFRETVHGQPQTCLCLCQQVNLLQELFQMPRT